MDSRTFYYAYLWHCAGIVLHIRHAPSLVERLDLHAHALRSQYIGAIISTTARVSCQGGQLRAQQVDLHSGVPVAQTEQPSGRFLASSRVFGNGKSLKDL